MFGNPTDEYTVRLLSAIAGGDLPGDELFDGEIPSSAAQLTATSGRAHS